MSTGTRREYYMKILKKSEDNNKGLFLNSENQYQDILQIDNNELLNLANRLYEKVN
ncbi:hypothetical protein WVI01_07900 [Weissella viridescens]|nr:hypothetical protein WVI01_07900 [Weissella viridescens]